MTVDLPRWLPIVGWVMIAVGILSFIGDVFSSDFGLRGSFGNVGLVLDVLLDVFLVGGGLLIVRVTKR